MLHRSNSGCRAYAIHEECATILTQQHIHCVHQFAWNCINEQREKAKKEKKKKKREKKKREKEKKKREKEKKKKREKKKYEKKKKKKKKKKKEQKHRLSSSFAAVAGSLWEERWGWGWGMGSVVTVAREDGKGISVVKP
ncbi:unnamed protein product [Taenia asiatica]|uniref:RING-CH-type domain-containing protein n=1 Tax=Taenia asiatica TaxID=60517 RepID=A0A0R3VZN0_TAEAS|nr:unnamed protein product [Taenia asiatica]